MSYLLRRSRLASRAGLSFAVRSITAYLFVPASSFFFIQYCTPMLTPISRGIITMLAMNALVCTAALYSRKATAKTLCMVIVSLSFGPRDADENLLQRRPGQFEVPYRSPLHQFGQDPLRIGVRPEREFLQLAEIGHLFDAGQIVERRRILHAHP